MNEKIITTLKDYEKFSEVFNWSMFSFDTETDSLSYDKQKLVGLSLCDGENAAYLPFRHDTGEEQLDFRTVGRLLLDKFRDVQLLIAHNMVFDCKVLYKEGVNVSHPEWFDTMVAAHLLDEEGSKKLKDLAKSILGVDNPQYFEDVAKKYLTANKVPIGELGPYAIKDAVYTWQLAVALKPKLVEQGLERLFRQIEMPFLRQVAEMEINGVLVDKTRAQNTKKELEQALLDTTVELYETLGEPYSIVGQQDLFGNAKLEVKGVYNFNSSHDLKEIIYARLKLPVEFLTPAGVPSTASEALERLSTKHPFIKSLIKYRIIQKLLTSFFNPLESLLDSDGRVRSSFKDTGTVTGRLSSSEPNLQQLPKTNKDFPVNTRSCFIASPGKKMISLDYSQQELRIMAHLSKDDSLIKLILDDGDQHLINARVTFNLDIPLEYCFTNHPKYKETKEQYHDKRDQGKVFSFSIPYGAGAGKIAKVFNVSVDEAQRMLDNYYGGFPGLKKAMEDTQRFAEEHGYVVTYTGRRRRFNKNQWGKLDPKAVRQSFNFLIQSFGADLIRIACTKVYRYSRKNPEYGVRLLMTVHDEIVLECWEAYADKVLEDCIALMESCGRLVVPLKASGNIGDNYGDVK